MSTTGRAQSLTGSIVGSHAASKPSRQRHPLTVRVTHWIATACFFALLVSGLEIVISHPRFYWGETGNDLTTPLFHIPIPSSRRHVPTGYSYVLPDQNGWSRALHFQSAWAVVLTGFAYVLFGAFAGHFSKNLIPGKAERSWRSIFNVMAHHLRFQPPDESEAWSYNVLQRLAYLSVIFILFPMIIWTGLAMSPAFVSAFPFTVTLLGGRQTARTIHFLVSLSLVMFLAVHVLMVWRAGFRNRVRAMITGRSSSHSERI
jgi:thiosulfate reductase cytochrome b subunit